VKSEAPDAVQMLPKTGFMVTVRRGHPSTYLIKESVCLPDRSRLEDRKCALAVMDEMGDVCVVDVGEKNPFRKAFLELASDLTRSWGLLAGMAADQKRQPTPDWLSAIRAERRKRKRSNKGCQLPN
jgi:hypothetical protein